MSLGPLQPDPSLARSKFADFHEGYVRHYITTADTKATLVLGLVSTLLAYLFGREHFHYLMFHPSWYWPAWLALATTALLGLSAACAILVVAPRLSHSGAGLIFFGAVAAQGSSERYLEQVSCLSEEQLTAARIQHSYDVSLACAQKYKMLRRAIWLGFAGVSSSLPILGMV